MYSEDATSIWRRLNQLGQEICCLNTNFCSKIDFCLGISSEGSDSLFLNQKGNFVSVSGGASAPLNEVVYGTGLGITSSSFFNYDESHGPLLNIFDDTGNGGGVVTGAIVLKSFDPLHTGSVTIQSDSTSDTQYTITWPPDAGTNGYVLQTDSTGITSWVPNGGSLNLQEVTDNGAVTTNNITCGGVNANNPNDNTTGVSLLVANDNFANKIILSNSIDGDTGVKYTITVATNTVEWHDTTNDFFTTVNLANGIGNVILDIPAQAGEFTIPISVNGVVANINGDIVLNSTSTTTISHTATYVVLPTDQNIQVTGDTGTSNIDISGMTINQTIIIKDEDGKANVSNIVLDSAIGNIIDDTQTKTMNISYQSLTIKRVSSTQFSIH